jgi:hypothetical protein
MTGRAVSTDLAVSKGLAVSTGSKKILVKKYFKK